MDHDTPPEESFDLIQRHRAGDPAALGKLIRRYYSRIERIVRIRLGAALQAVETVEDVVQDVIVRVLEGLERYEPRGDARWIDWVATVAQREIQNLARRERTQKRGGGLLQQVRLHAESAADADIAAETTGVQSAVARREMIARLDRCVAESSEPHREVIVLRDYASGDWKTVAEQMGRSAEACQELHRRARIDLAKRLRGKT